LSAHKRANRHDICDMGWEAAAKFAIGARPTHRLASYISFDIDCIVYAGFVLGTGWPSRRLLRARP